MLKGLRLRLTILFTIFTGAVLAVALGISLYLSVSQTVSDREQWFASTIDGVAAYLDNVSYTEDTAGYLLAEEPYAIAIRRGEQFEEVKGWTPRTAQAELFDVTKAEALEQGLVSSWVEESYIGQLDGELQFRVSKSTDEALRPDDEIIETAPREGVGTAVTFVSGPIVSNEGIFRLRVDGVPYRATYFEWIPAGTTGTAEACEVALLEDLTGQNRELAMTALGHVALFLLGLIILFLASWILAKRMLQPTEESIRRQNEFVAAASHELRSPLAVIRSSLSAAEVCESGEESQKFTAAARYEAERMSHLIEDLLLLAGGDAGNWPVNKRPFDLDTLLIETAETYTPLAREENVSLQLDLPEATLPAAFGDPDRLRQILAVLLDNALQYAPAGSEISLSASVRKHRVALQVTDHGPGIPEEDKEQVFRRFYRADSSRVDKRHFGLGLSIAKELATLMGAELTLSDTEGSGATFTLLFPLQKGSVT